QPEDRHPRDRREAEVRPDHHLLAAGAVEDRAVAQSDGDREKKADERGRAEPGPALHARVEGDDASDEPADDPEGETEVQPEPAAYRGEEREDEDPVARDARERVRQEPWDVHSGADRDRKQDDEEEPDDQAWDPRGAHELAGARCDPGRARRGGGGRGSAPRGGAAHEARSCSPAIARPNAASGASGGRIAAIRPAWTMAIRSQIARSSTSSEEV